MEFKLTFLLLEKLKLECALDRCNHDVAHEYWYVEIKITKILKDDGPTQIEEHRFQNSWFRALNEIRQTKHFFNQVLLNVGPILTV